LAIEVNYYLHTHMTKFPKILRNYCFKNYTNEPKRKSCISFFLTLSIPGIIAMAVPGVRGNISEFTVV